MQFLVPLSLLIIACFLLDLFGRFYHLLLSLSVPQCASLLKLLCSGSDGEDGILAAQCCSRQVVAAVALVLIARLGLRALPFGLGSKEIVRSLCEFKRKASELGGSDEVSRNRVDLKVVKTFDSPKSNESVTWKANKLVEEDEEEEKEEDRECSSPEDEIFDVLALREMVKIERRRTIAASVELEKERIAAASAAEEAMSLILRLQSEKSAIEMRANQDRRLAEQKRQYDREVIDSLRWMAASHESRRRALADRLRSCRRSLMRARASSEGSSGVEGESCFGSGGSEENVSDSVMRNGDDDDDDDDDDDEEEEEEEEETRSLDDVLMSSLELDSLIEE